MTSDSGRQPSLFTGEPSSNVIPFDSIPRSADSSASKPEPRGDSGAATAVRRALAPRAIARKTSANRTGIDTQGSFDLEYLPQAPQSPRTLKTTVEAQIYCDAEVAAPMHRSVAAILDSAMIAMGCGIFVAIFQMFGGGIQADRFDLVVLAVALLLIMLFYGFLFAFSNRETAGQAWTELRLINFDGMPPDRASRFLRFLGCWLSFCACGIGLLWSLMDEENLTWHDHMSKTFPTMREIDSTLFRERPR